MKRARSYRELAGGRGTDEQRNAARTTAPTAAERRADSSEADRQGREQQRRAVAYGRARGRL